MITREMLTTEQWEKRHAYVKLYHAIHRAKGIEPFVDKEKFEELTPAEFTATEQNIVKGDELAIFAEENAQDTNHQTSL